MGQLRLGESGTAPRRISVGPLVRYPSHDRQIGGAIPPHHRDRYGSEGSCERRDTTEPLAAVGYEPRDDAECTGSGGERSGEQAQEGAHDRTRRALDSNATSDLDALRNLRGDARR